MKRSTRLWSTFLALSLFTGLLSASCRREAASGATPTGAAPAQDREVEFLVEGMHCETCPITVKVAAQAVPGVVDARVSIEAGRAWVHYRPADTGPAAIAAAITNSGYPAKELQPGP